MSAAVTGAIVAPRTLAAVIPPPASSSTTSAKYRGAVVEDMQLPPAVAVPRTATVSAALNVAHDHDYSQLPLVSTTDRKLLGYVDVAVLRKRLSEGTLIGSDPVDSAMIRFGAGAGSSSSNNNNASQSASSSSRAGSRNTYTIIDPNTGLGELEVFLQSHPFALVTDPSRSFVLAVATRDDLDKFVARRGLGGAAGGSGTSTQQPAVPLTRREEEEARKDRTLAQFMLMLDDYKPLIPDEVTDYYLEKVGFECDDVRLKRFLSLAAEKFVSDIAADAFQYARIRTNAGPAGKPKAGGGAGAGGTGPGGSGGASGSASAKDRSKTVLTMDDLSAALGEYGVNARRAEWYR
ncbi:hypothetical protein OC846_002350 [Tilletia horrida]|uniref:CBS domain-containing protein n=1 Tax=Tilletia horrida TaxID=155126 RepID=A0AAN6GS13_9BASI|nr:hypothetical protein OC845_002480 [Tilletia horrida]KAK0553819.1 hypothetical protein OC846_002350 [Tilletia horrida]KAK0567782.1 hypothetical protein OC861_002525 [Tilletia horrida]